MSSIQRTPVSQDSHTIINGARIKIQRLSHSESPLPETPVLIFLHEGIGSIKQWKSFPENLCKKTGLDGLVYDRLGHGRSDPLPSPEADPEHMHREARICLPELLDKNRIKRCILIGHSDGGSIGLIYAAHHPKRVQGIITEAAHVFVDPLTLNGIENTAQAYEHGDLGSRLARYHGENTDTLFRRWADTWRSREFSNWNLEALLPRITCPVLAIQGEEDEYGLPSQARAITAGVGGPGETWFVPGCRHAPHLQARRKVLNRCSRFVCQIVKSAKIGGDH